jgi:two-component system chemotaxis family response regulator WspR
MLSTDIAARYGGEVFAVLIPHTDAFGAMIMAEQIRDAVLDRILPHPGSPCGRLTVSIGVATLTSIPGSLVADLVGKAGIALAEAGRLGSNRIEADAAVVAAAATAAGWFGGPGPAGRTIDG